jgi:2-polyprenyl-3-methyl-5-hydroxy-6-metoxy-1,4-benzoquinol methylase
MSQQTECLACGSTDLNEVLNLGDQHPVNAIQTEPTVGARYPLRLVACANCGHAQQRYLVDPSELFSDYFYASSTSRSLDEYSHEFVLTLSKALGPDLRVLEIASNDGILLKHLNNAGYRSTGIDPAHRMVERAVSQGLDAIEGFWPDAAAQLGDQQFDVVLGQNVLAHTPGPVPFLAGVAAVLADDGIAIFQTSQADMVFRNEFDTIYHEHFSFFCERSAAEAATRAGLTLLGTVYTPIHGTSALFILGKTNAARSRAQALITSFQTDFPESNFGVAPEAMSLRRVRRASDWAKFGAAARSILAQLAQTANEIQRSGRKLIAVGASAKGITAMRAAGIDPDELVDEAIDKIGMYVDGISLPISDLDNEQLLSGNCVFFFTAWNFSRELSEKLIRRGVDPASNAVLFFPEVHEVTIGSLAAQT